MSIFQPPSSDRPHEVLTGQYALGIPLLKVMNDTKCDVVELRRRDASEIGTVKKVPGIAGGPVVAGTRIRVASIGRLAEDGYNPEDILKEYPDLTLDDISAALAYHKVAA